MTDTRQRRTRLRRTAVAAAAATAGAIALSWLFNYLLLFVDGLSAFARSATTATVLPVLLAGPLTAFGMWQREEAWRMRRANALAASRNPATGCVAQKVLSVVVEERRRKPPSPDGSARGAFLLLELDELKRINARFGPDWSAAALALVADTIRSSVRAGDLVGRLETGEFGIFLPGASEEDAQRVGQRVVDAVASAYFAPEGIESMVGARVAGIVFDHQLEFAEMVRRAAAQLIDMPAGKSLAAVRLETATAAPALHA